MQPQRVLRFQVSGREVLDRMASDPLPFGLEHSGRDLDVFRLIYFDTVARDLERRGATVRLRIPRNGSAQLSVVIHESETHEGGIVRQIAEAAVADLSLPRVFSGRSEPARLVRALIDPTRLTSTFELEVMRRLRSGKLEGLDEPVVLTYDAVTARRDDLTGEFHEVEVRLPGEDGHFEGLVQELQARYGTRLTLADTVARAREMLSDLEVSGLEREIRSAREVAVVPFRDGQIALCRSGSGLQIPGGHGTGMEACHRVLRGWFGGARGRLRILGTSAGSVARPALEVWLAEGMGPDGEGPGECVWLPLDDVLAMAGSAHLRDARTLAALHAIARSDLPGQPLPGENGRDASQQADEHRILGGLMVSDDEDPILDGVTGKEKRAELLFNQELSRLAFDERMLVIVENRDVPLLERVRFLSMFGSRQDDFFSTRVAEAKDQVAAGSTRRTPDGMTPTEQLDAVRIRGRRIATRAYDALREVLLPELEAAGIRIERWVELDERDQDYLRDRYSSQAEAVITPLVADPSHPFPHIRNLRPAIGLTARLPESSVEHFVAIELPSELPRFVPLPGERSFVPLEEVILAIVPRLYSGLEVIRAHTFRVTRSASSQLDTRGGRDMLQAVEEEVAMRPFRQVVRLEVESTMPADMRARILRELRYETPESVSMLSDADVFPVPWLVDLAALREIASVDVPELRYRPLERHEPLPADRSIFDLVRERDRLVCFPHDSFSATVERFLTEAAEDPAVAAIKITLYRTDPNSEIVRALARARAEGKDAFALVELKASFDERRNIEWAKSLEAAGVHVVFSPQNYKVHAKTALVLRREAEGVRQYMYIGTGNLNAATAAAYTDVGLLTADPDLGAEVNAVFNLLTGYSGGEEFKHLLVSPFNMRTRFLELIEREIGHARAGRDAHIRIQLNGLSDRRIIRALYRASQAGVRLDLAVREICRLRPGLPNLSENIRVKSLLGRLLQHSRIFCFANGGDPEYYIGSADWRPRNLSWRVEVVTPIRDPDHRVVLDRLLDSVLEDPDAWELRPDGAYVRGDEVVGGAPLLEPRHAGR